MTQIRKTAETYVLELTPVEVTDLVRVLNTYPDPLHICVPNVCEIRDRLERLLKGD